MSLDQLKNSIINGCIIDKTAIIKDHVNLYRCKIGANTKIDSFVYIEEGVEIGNGTKIRPFCFIPTGVIIGNNVFIGPNVTFTNDRFPRIGHPWTLIKTVVQDDVSIGAGSVILPGVVVGKGALIGAGTVVTKTVPPKTIVRSIYQHVHKEI